MKVLLTFGLLLSLSQVVASDLKIKKVKELGPMKHQVIFQSDILKSTKMKNEYTGALVLKWGVYVYEVVSATYKCSSNNVCSIIDYKRIQTFENCSIKKQKVKCINPLSAAQTSDADSSRNDTTSPDIIIDEFDNDRRDSTESDFPERSSDEFGDLF